MYYSTNKKGKRIRIVETRYGYIKHPNRVSFNTLHVVYPLQTELITILNFEL